jgi:hypothetical protein
MPCEVRASFTVSTVRKNFQTHGYKQRSTQRNTYCVGFELLIVVTMSHLPTSKQVTSGNTPQTEKNPVDKTVTTA